MRSAQFFDSLNGAVRANPLAAGLIGTGLAWILLRRSAPAVRQASGAALTARRTVDSALDAAAGAVRGTVDEVRKAATQVTDTMSEGVRTAADNLGDAMEGAAKKVAGETGTQNEFARHFPPPSSNRLADLLNRQPLALAAVGVAVGAAIASALPSTSTEDRWLGTAGDKVKETVSDAAGTVADRAGSVIEEATDEAVAQNLTPGAMREAAEAGAAKLKKVAGAGLSTLGK